DLAVLDTQHILAYRGAQGAASEEFFRLVRSRGFVGIAHLVKGGSGDQPVHAEGLLVEENPGPQPEQTIESMVRAFLIERGRFDAQAFHQAGGWCAVRRWTVDQHGAAVQELQLPAQMKFIAFGVAAKIVVILENEDSCVLASSFPVEMCGSQSADSSTDDDEIVFFAEFLNCWRGLPERT